MQIVWWNVESHELRASRTLIRISLSLFMLTNATLSGRHATLNIYFDDDERIMIMLDVTDDLALDSNRS